MGQMSFYSADAHPRALTDLEGVLCAAGEVTVFGQGRAARVSIVLGDPPPPPPEDEGDDDGAELPDPEALAPGEPPAGDGDPDDTDGGRRHRDRPDDRAGGPPPVDPEELAFLDLDPDELAALLAPPPSPPPADASPSRDGGPPAVPGPAHVATAPPDPVADWRARALCCAFTLRGVDAEILRAPDGRPLVRSAFRADLAALARGWTGAAGKTVPDGLELDGPRLRLWVLAAGRVEGRAYALGLDPAAGHLHERLLTASRRAGLGAVLGGDAGRPVLRIVGSRRRRRLAELVGDRPRAVADGVWPDD